MSPYVECQKFQQGVLKEISERHKYSKRAIQRYIKEVKQVEHKRYSTTMTQLKRAPSKEPDHDMEKALNVNNDLDGVTFWDNDDEIKHLNDRLEDSTPCSMKGATS